MSRLSCKMREIEDLKDQENGDVQCVEWGRKRTVPALATSEMRENA